MLSVMRNDIQWFADVKMDLKVILSLVAHQPTIVQNLFVIEAQFVKTKSADMTVSVHLRETLGLHMQNQVLVDQTNVPMAILIVHQLQSVNPMPMVSWCVKIHVRNQTHVEQTPCVEWKTDNPSVTAPKDSAEIQTIITVVVLESQ